MRGRRRSGDGFISCTCGRRHWGRFGAAGLLVLRGDSVLLQHRAQWSHEGGTWGVPGGALDAGESALQGALREAAEEAAVPAAAVRPQHAWTVDHGTWRYTTVIAYAQAAFEPQRLDGESQELRWVPLRDVPALPLHAGFAAGWRSYAPLLTRR
jgi:8-oxo-dGTP pyrophosphatase MutT (NUDIX family)